MNKEEYKIMFDTEETYWWFVSRRKLVVNLLKQYLKVGNNKLLDIGCGTGNNLREFNQFGDAIGVDSSQDAIEFCKQRGLTNVLLQSAEEMDLQKDSFNAITLLDVLEHVQDDMSLLKKCNELCAPNGFVLITVPAYGFLWSEHDEALHHKRRYTASELRNKLNVSGFKIMKISYAVTTLFFPIFFMRFWQSIFKKSVYPQSSIVLLPKPINDLIIKILDVENFLMKKINFPIGTSVVCIATKE